MVQEPRRLQMIILFITVRRGKPSAATRTCSERGYWRTEQVVDRSTLQALPFLFLFLGVTVDAEPGMTARSQR